MIDALIDLVTGSGAFIDLALLISVGLLVYVAFADERK